MRPPDRIINGDYLHRWYVIPRNKYFNIYLHRFTASDDDRALHDHPWWSLSFCLKGKLVEVREDTHSYIGIPDYEKVTYRTIKWMFPYVRKPRAMHRMVLVGPEAWTVFFTGPNKREWGFRTPDGGWIAHWKWHELHNPPTEYFTYTEPGENDEPVDTIMSREQILDYYWVHWKSKMKAAVKRPSTGAYGKPELITPANCIDDWVVVNWATRCDEEGNPLTNEETS